MIRSNPLRKPAHALPVAVVSLLLLSAGMCRQAEEPSPVEVTGATDSEQAAAAAAQEEARALALEQAAAEAEEQKRLAAIAAAEEELATREARLAEEQEQLRRERAQVAERERRAAELAAAAERERQLAAREQELREQEALLAQREEELIANEDASAEPAAPEPLPEPTANYEGDFDEPWRETQEPADTEPVSPSTGTVAEEVTPDDDGPAEPATSMASVQAGERLEVQTLTTLSSETARVGDTFSARLVDDLRDAGGTVVIPAGAEVIGRISEASPYRRGGGPATLGVEFTDIVVSPEQTVGIRATFLELGADRRKNRKKVVAGAVVGAILGHILGGDGSANVIFGAAAGAAAGGAVVASAKDRDAEIPGGQIIALQLEEVVTVEIEYGPVAGRQPG